MKLEEQLAREIAIFRSKGRVKIEFKKHRSIQIPLEGESAEVEDQKFLANNGKFRCNDILSID